MNINNKLITFSNELVLSKNDTERARVNASLTQLEKVVRDKIPNEISEIKRFGSFTRNTILPRKYDTKSDVDLMVVFKSTGRIYTPNTYRKWLYDIIAVAYPNSICKKDFPVVKLELNHIMFDIVPSVILHDWWNGYQYKIPESGDSWRTTVPNDINEVLTQRNQYYGNNTVRNIIRLCKHWNAFKGYPFESYLMEKHLIGLNFNGDNTYSGFIYALKNFGMNVSGTSQAIDYIEHYKRNENYTKQVEWLRKLLPYFY